MTRSTRSIVKAFHHAIDESDIELARMLLAVMEKLLERTPTSAAQQRWMRDNVVAAHERLWMMQHPEAE